MMRDDFEKVFLNEYGYYELKKKPSVEDRQREFEEEYYQSNESTYESEYSPEEKKFFNNKLEQKRIIIEKNIGAEVDGLSLLDIACGEGFVLDYFDRLGCRVCGMDFSKWAIEHHNPRMAANFMQGDCVKLLPELIKKGEKFDVINIDSALDMMLEPERVVDMCRQLLTDRGIFLVKVANNYSNLQQTLLESGQLTREHWLDDPGHPSYFNKDGFVKFMEAHKFKCVDLYGESFIDLNLLNPDTNYYEKSGVGKNCYNAKLQLENMLHDISPEKSLEIFKILGQMGFGREIIGVFVA